MGIFDFIELRNHIQAIGEYVFYMVDTACLHTADLPADFNSSLNFIRDHLKKMTEVLDKIEKG